jgi:hypothetical protein
MRRGRARAVGRSVVELLVALSVRKAVALVVVLAAFLPTAFGCEACSSSPALADRHTPVVTGSHSGSNLILGRPQKLSVRSSSTVRIYRLDAAAPAFLDVPQLPYVGLFERAPRTSPALALASEIHSCRAPPESPRRS